MRSASSAAAFRSSLQALLARRCCRPARGRRRGRGRRGLGRRLLGRVPAAAGGEHGGSQEHQRRKRASSLRVHGLVATAARPIRRDHEGSRAAPGVWSCRTRPVSVSMIQICRRPVRSEMKAMWRPSGAQVGSSLRPDGRELRRRVPARDVHQEDLRAPRDVAVEDDPGARPATIPARWKRQWRRSRTGPAIPDRCRSRPSRRSGAVPHAWTRTRCADHLEKRLVTSCQRSVPRSSVARSSGRRCSRRKCRCRSRRSARRRASGRRARRSA